MGHYPNIFFLLLQRTHLEVRRLRKLIPIVLMGVNLRNRLKMCCVHCSREGNTRDCARPGGCAFPGSSPEGPLQSIDTQLPVLWAGSAVFVTRPYESKLSTVA